ncbi:hypothetical protein [Geminocystis sp. GBBB08]|uniref:hypothetical protein n=1 Tax=Geminocystis sp. GBBB08 TaxID=2604140 RepID=UPI0027E394CE|nr:hypothetical protein [Geminocystis sp. GBBB08]MBL1208859.1 hypothetical protein [Geminocystis sp. GBBB08]
MDLYTLLKPSLESLVKEINAVNHSWKLAIEMFDNHHPLSQSLSDLKVRLQVILLRNYAHNFVYLIEDNDTKSDEPLYSLQLIFIGDKYKDAAHVPIRVAKEILSSEEITNFSKS